MKFRNGLANSVELNDRHAEGQSLRPIIIDFHTGDLVVRKVCCSISGPLDIQWIVSMSPMFTDLEQLQTIANQYIPMRFLSTRF